MNLYLLMKLLHVLAAFWWAGQVKEVHAVNTLLQISDFFERYAVIPISVAVLVFGLIVTWMQKWPILGFLQGSASNWLLVSFVLFVGISALIGPLGLSARRRERARAVEEALAQGSMTLRLMAALQDQVVTRFRTVELVTVVAIIILMVTKPFQETDGCLRM